MTLYPFQGRSKIQLLKRVQGQRHFEQLDVDHQTFNVVGFDHAGEVHSAVAPGLFMLAGGVPSRPLTAIIAFAKDNLMTDDVTDRRRLAPRHGTVNFAH